MNLIGREMLVLAAALVAVQSGAADRPSTKELLQQAGAVAAAGKIEQAESIACSASTREQKNKELQQACDTYRRSAQAQRDADHNHLNKGAADFVMKKFDAAESEFQAIKSTSFSTLKKEWLDKVTHAQAQAELEQQKKKQELKLAEEAAQKQAAEAEAAMRANLDRGIAAYEKNDFATAQRLLAAISGKYQEQAQKYMANIDQYNSAMRKGANYEKAAEPKRALAAYQQAFAVKANGPLNPKEKIASLQQVVAQSDMAQKTETVTPVPLARDQALLSAIQEYYRGDYESSEKHLAAYAGTSEKLTALGHFYLGASRLSQYYLGTDNATKDRLLQSAIAELQLAKHTPDFVPPKSSVSPKVVEVYETSVP